jgi:hypothetical protein
MNPPTRSEVRSKAGQGQTHRGNPRVEIVPQAVRSHEQTPPWNPVGPYAPDERAEETFGDGAGI